MLREEMSSILLQKSPGMGNTGGNTSGVRAKSIIDTLSEMALQNETSQVVSVEINGKATSSRSKHNRSASVSQTQLPNGNSSQPPRLQPRSPHVRLPTSNANSPDLNSSFGGHQSKREMSNNLSFSAATTSSPKTGFSPSKTSKTGITNSSREISKTGFGSQSRKSLSNTRGQTPDWIREIFSHARRGLLEKLTVSLSNLEPTLIRNLTDHSGNNLVHAICLNGHVSLLPWATRRLGAEVAGALADQNKARLTPLMVAIKHGRLECLQYLLRHFAVAAEKKLSRNGERSLLHSAAKFGQDEIVAFLAEDMIRHDINVDQTDIGGNTPLHLASRKGRISTCSILLRYGAKLDLKNDMGLKPMDCSRLSKMDECSEFLLLYETSLKLSRQTLNAKRSIEVLRKENADLRTQFKEVISISRKMQREREEISRDMSKTYEHMLNVHDKMAAEWDNLKVQGGDKFEEELRNFHETLMESAKKWITFASSNETENKLVVLEENWRRIRIDRAHDDAALMLDLEDSPQESNEISSGKNEARRNSEIVYNHRHLRDRMEELRTNHQTPAVNLPETSSDEDDEISSEDNDRISKDVKKSHQRSEDEDEEVYYAESKTEEGRKAREMRRLRRNIAQRKKLATPVSSNKYYSINDTSIYSSLSHENSPQSPTQQNASSNQNQQKVEFNLKSENGTASVIEVIEPTLSEEEEFHKSLKAMNIFINNNSENEKNLNSLPVNLPSRRQSTDNPLKHQLSVKQQPPTETIHHNHQLSVKSESPTKRLLEMGISPHSVDLDREQLEDNKTEPASLVIHDTSSTRRNLNLLKARSNGSLARNGNASGGKPRLSLPPSAHHNQQTEPSNVLAKARTIERRSLGSGGGQQPQQNPKKNNFLQKIGILKKSTKEESNSLDDSLEVEEHILPDTLDMGIGQEQQNMSKESSDSVKITNRTQKVNKSTSPQSRKSLFGSKTTVSLAASEDSGLGSLGPNHHRRLASNLSNSNQPDSLSPPSSGEFGSANLSPGIGKSLGKIEEVSSVVSSSTHSHHSSSHHGPLEHRGFGSAATTSKVVRSKTPRHNGMSPIEIVRKKSIESKAWYDCPSDEDLVMEEEADSLASIISNKTTSDDD